MHFVGHKVGMKLMPALWHLEIFHWLGEWPHAVVLVVGFVSWFVVALGHGFASKLGELLAANTWKILHRRTNRSANEDDTYDAH